jgi:benzylsuccinate CoA-transferase BbsE subunit
MTLESEETDSAMGPYRVLDLTEGGFNWSGKVLADLGADVIKVEPLSGSATRLRGPFYKDEVHPERSLFWYAYCINKRGITLDLESPDGQQLFRKLAATADFVMESFPPGYMDNLGIGYKDLSRISFPQAELHAGAQAAAGAMVAFWRCQKTGAGQQVDVSMQEAIIWCLMGATSFPPLHDINAERAGAYRKMGFLVYRGVYPCTDGYISALVIGGVLGGNSMRALVRWMDEEGMAPDFMKERDWYNWDTAAVAAQGEDGMKDVEAVQKSAGDFFASKTKAELYERAVTDRILIAPCNTVQDIWESPQLKAREFWVEVYHPELDVPIHYMGPYIGMSKTPIRVRRRAPLIGEHNEDIYVRELGLTKERLEELKKAGVV